MPKKRSLHDGETFASLNVQQPVARTSGLRVARKLWKTARLAPALLLALLPCVHEAATARAADASQLPLFRHIDAALVKAHPPKPVQIRFLLSDDLPPFAYRNRNGALTGFSVAVAQAICRQARVRCQFIVRPFDQLVDNLLQERGDVILGGVRPTAPMWEKLDFTRPYYKALGRFAVARGVKTKQVSLQSLAGRRVVVVKGSVHALWLARYMGSVRVVLKPDFASAAQELREGRADALFGDWLQLAFWVRSKNAGNCCRLLGKLIVAPTFSYNDLSMALPPLARSLRDFLDRQLDLLQEDGELRILAKQFLPLSGGAEAGKASEKGKEKADAAGHAAK